MEVAYKDKKGATLAVGQPATMSNDAEFIEIDLTTEELDNIKRGRFPSMTILVDDKLITISVGVV